MTRSTPLTNRKNVERMIRARWVSIALLSCSPSLLIAQERHVLKDDHPPTGSLIKREVASWSIPIDKTYDELTAAELEIFRSHYEGLKSNEEPPFPAKGMEPIIRDLVKVQSALQVRGQLFVVATVDPEGSVSNISVYESPSKRMSKAAAVILFGTKFKPASCSANPCEMEFPLIVDMKLK